MTDYVYHGPMQGLTLCDEQGKAVWEGMLAPGKTYTNLPEGHPHIETFKAGGLLKPPPPGAPGAAPKRIPKTPALKED